MKKLTFALILLVATGLVSCNKYEDGPGFSLMTKKARMGGLYTVEFASADGIDVTSAQDWEFDIDKKGFIRQTGYLLGFEINQTGRWEFTNSKKNMKITWDSGDTEEYQITKLEIFNVWLKSLDGDDIIHLTEL